MVPELAAALVASITRGPPHPGAACVGLAPLMDDKVEGEHRDEREQRLAVAARVCQRCPVRRGCEWSLVGAAAA